MPEDLYAERCLRAGADGFVAKSALSATLLDAVQTVLGGQIWVSPGQRDTLLRRATGRGAGASDRPELSVRELEVLRLVAAGRSTREIAEQLNRSVKTIETHKQSLKSKLDADSPAMLVRKAIAFLGEGGDDACGRRCWARWSWRPPRRQPRRPRRRRSCTSPNAVTP
jgi:DNA-binding NarL/FixJ family response regulator